MPAQMEKALKTRAKKLGLKGKRAKAHIYGSLRKTGWKPRRER